MKDAGVQDTGIEAVETAVARVLQAEQAARRAIEDTRAEAEHIAERARAAARAIAERSRQRMARGHERLQQSLRDELAAIDAASRALPDHDEPDAFARARVERAVRALAAALTGAAEGPKP